MLRIHFTATDIARTTVAREPDPLWEIVLSLHILQTPHPPARYRRWRAGAAARILHRDLGAKVRHLLFPLTPVATYFPDFLTPSEAAEGIDAGIDAVTATPTSRMSAQLGRMATRTTAPAWARELAEGSAELRADLGATLRAYHDTALAPAMADLGACVAADRAVRIRALATGGVEGLLRGLRPMARWECPASSAPDGTVGTLVAGYPADHDLRLDGRGVVLVPSFFCLKSPVVLVDPDMRPVLVYPAAETAPAAVAAAGGCSTTALENLLGTTRAAVLLSIEDGCTAKRLTRRAGVSPATISHHTSVLREAGLITTHRSANTAVHALTPLGARLVGRPGAGLGWERSH
ncbi:Helix-turn-helix domain-containing protein [Amycolatopsis arida]|uniref:Helix-turn-helix domain-containing protein n=1 Tax=Amycolatopsis arida TaxID=587909 RepID=A0A1I5LX78_9PSEU|nr:winged helix-turn-helix domain-containing protein [Amycolatopsis arida]TDX93886.1 helix-turn-helix protein [Amycolatopsis arida]SFP01939.1 Helix-turn-helix domain-containing protein [Amycolatopsis arida]